FAVDIHDFARWLGRPETGTQGDRVTHRSRGCERLPRIDRHLAVLGVHDERIPAVQHAKRRGAYATDARYPYLVYARHVHAAFENLALLLRAQHPRPFAHPSGFRDKGRAVGHRGRGWQLDRFVLAHVATVAARA